MNAGLLLNADYECTFSVSGRKGLKRSVVKTFISHGPVAAYVSAVLQRFLLNLREQWPAKLVVGHRGDGTCNS